MFVQNLTVTTKASPLVSPLPPPMITNFFLRPYLNKKYAPKETVTLLNNLNLQFPMNQMHVIVGSTGSGM